MSVLPSHLKYTENHEWVYLNEHGEAVVGVTDFAQESLGELTSVTFPELGMDVAAGDEIMELEAVMAASIISAPLSGEIVEINETLEESPEQVNDEPYDAGWLFKIQVHDESELNDLLSDDEYQARLDAE